MNKGFVIVAQNTSTVNYVDCAIELKHSIHRCMPNAAVTILDLPDLVPDSEWKLFNDWQVYDASPYEYTIKLEADMIVPSSIEHWWPLLTTRDIVVCQTIRNYDNQISNVKAYRQFITDNELPDVYNAITYFRKSDNAKQFYSIVRNVFENWDEYKATLKCNKDEQVTTDWAYSIACHIMGVENTTLPFDAMSMVHMKQFINNTITDDWTNELIAEFEPFRINTYPQLYPFHYHQKKFVNEIKGYYGRI